MLDLEIVFTLIFFAAVGLLLLKDKKNVEFNYGIVVRRWRRGIHLIDNAVNKHRTFFTVFGNIGIIVGVAGGLLGFAFLAQSSLNLKQEFSFVLPSFGGYNYPGPVISIPFWYWLVGIFVIIAAHETMHAIFSRLEKIPIKSYGVLLLLIFPIGAFVDPDMKKTEKLKSLKKLRIYAAGSFANLTLAGVFGIVLFLFNQLFVPSGVYFGTVINGTPAYNANMTGIITTIDNQPIRNHDDLLFVLNNTRVGEGLNITTTNGTYMIKTISRPDNPGKPFIGINETATVYALTSQLKGIEGVVLTANKLFMWLFVLNVGVGVVNLLPMKPFDGGYIFKEIFDKIWKGHGEQAINILSLITFSLIIFNIFGVSVIKALI